MQCPKCKAKMYNGCCIQCGYMINGNTIKESSSTDKYKDIKLYNKSFEKMIMNKNTLITFLLGPLYFSYKSHMLTGLLLSIFDISLIRFVINWLNMYVAPSNIIMSYEVKICIFIYICVARIIYVSFANTICLKLDDSKIKKIKSKYKNYEELLTKHKDTSIIKLTLNIAFCFLIVLLMIRFK